MTRDDAETLAQILGGEPTRRDDDTWAVVIRRADERLVVITGRSVEEYGDPDALDAGLCYDSIALS